MGPFFEDNINECYSLKDVIVSDLSKMFQNIADKKDIGTLARSGFNFEISNRVLEISKEEYNKIINLL